jgi:hypothetical protein
MDATIRKARKMLQSAFPIDFLAYFSVGAAIRSERAEPVAEWRDGQKVGQQHDKITGKPLWSVPVVDMDPNARKGQGEVTVKIASATEPQLPPTLPGLPLRPAVFEGLSITPYVSETTGRPRVAFSLRATEIKAATEKRRGE